MRRNDVSTVAEEMHDLGPSVPRRVAATRLGAAAPLEHGDEVLDGQPSCMADEIRDFADVYEAHIDFLWRALQLLGVPRTELEDACQDVLTVLHRQLSTIGADVALRAWIFGVARGVARNYQRSQRRKKSPLVSLDTAAGVSAAAVPAHGLAIEAADIIQRFYASLDASSQAVFLLALVEQLPAPAVGMELGLSAAAVQRRVRALRAALEDFVAGQVTHG